MSAIWAENIPPSTNCLTAKPSITAKHSAPTILGGKLTYTIDFAAKQGHGKIEHLKTPEQNVELASAELKADEKSHAVILGDTRYGGEEKGTYRLALFGDRAQEIAGSATVKIGEKVHEIGIADKQ